jgi:hypothetical protein
MIARGRSTTPHAGSLTPPSRGSPLLPIPLNDLDALVSALDASKKGPLNVVVAFEVCDLLGGGVVGLAVEPQAAQTRESSDLLDSYLRGQVHQLSGNQIRVASAPTYARSSVWVAEIHSAR